VFARGVEKVLDQICSSAKGGRPSLEAEELGFTIAMVKATGLIDAALANEVLLVGEVKKMLGLSGTGQKASADDGRHGRINELRRKRRGRRRMRKTGVLHDDYHDLEGGGGGREPRENSLCP